MSNLNPPLTINVHIIDIATDKEESKKIYELRKVSIDVTQPITSRNGIDKIAKLYEMQELALDKKWKVLQNLILWAMNNKKELVFTNVNDDD